MNLKAVEDKPKQQNDELDGLPPELLKALSESFKKGRTTQLPNVLLDKVASLLANGPKSMDEMMVGIYHKYEEVISSRNNFSTKLNVLAKNGHLKAHGRGIYGLPDAV